MVSLARETRKVAQLTSIRCVRRTESSGPKTNSPPSCLLSERREKGQPSDELGQTGERSHIAPVSSNLADTEGALRITLGVSCDVKGRTKRARNGP